MKISLVFLTLNEAIGLKQIFDSIPLSAVDEVFAIDGGSTDGTIEFFAEKGVQVFTQQKRGRGEAFRLAFQQATGDAVLFFSPDGNETPEDITKFRQYLDNGSDLVIASRMVKGARNEEDDQLFKWRKWANNAFNLMANMTWNRGKFVTDSINGFRAIKKTAWEKVQPDGSGYTIEYQTTIRSLKEKLTISEFPTYEGNRIDDREGSPSIPTGIAFIKIYFYELWLGKKYKAN